jgi:hypothetical protein
MKNTTAAIYAQGRSLALHLHGIGLTDAVYVLVVLLVVRVQLLRRLPAVKVSSSSSSIAKPWQSFPRALRRALPLRLLQLVTLLRSSHAQLVVAAKAAGRDPPPDLNADMLRQAFPWPQLLCSDLFRVEGTPPALEQQQQQQQQQRPQVKEEEKSPMEVEESKHPRPNGVKKEQVAEGAVAAAAAATPMDDIAEPIVKRETQSS